MVYRVIGLMSGSSLDGLDIAYVEFNEQAGQWSFEIRATECYSYSPAWMERLKSAVTLSAQDYQLLHVDYGHYLGREVNRFIDQHDLQYQVALVSSHGHTTFHLPNRRMTAQLGDGAAIAAETRLPVVTDLRAMDIAFGGQGAPIVPIGEKLLFKDYDYFLNLGGIANISINAERYLAFDVCPANRVLNMLSNELGREFDEGGQLAAGGLPDQALLEKLNALEYYDQPFPKSLANDFGTDVVYPLIKQAGLSPADSLRTYTEHIATQIKRAIGLTSPANKPTRLLATGGGALNQFLISRLEEQLREFHTSIVIPDKHIVNYKEALIMALIGVLRWRQEYNVLSSVTGAERDTIGGALWTGQEA
jgi:anhydro-N-acetylmuramic acid kinase